MPDELSASSLDLPGLPDKPTRLCPHCGRAGYLTHEGNCCSCLHQGIGTFKMLSAKELRAQGTWCLSTFRYTSGSRLLHLADRADYLDSLHYGATQAEES